MTISFRCYDARTPEGYAAIRQALSPPFAGGHIVAVGLETRGSALIALSRLHDVLQVDRAASTPKRVIRWPLSVGGWIFTQQRLDKRQQRLRPVYRWRWL